MQPKVKAFLCRACHNILPTQTGLFDRKISSTFSCLWCEDEPESCDRVLWRCEFAQRVWFGCLVKLPAGVYAQITFMDMLSCCLKELSSPDVELVFTLAWMLWNSRNKLMWDGKHCSVSDICYRASSMALDFIDYREGANHGQQLVQVGEGSQWCPLVLSSYKVSLACSYHQGSQYVGVGILIRDSTGFVVVVAAL